MQSADIKEFNLAHGTSMNVVVKDTSARRTKQIEHTYVQCCVAKILAGYTPDL
jgi:hypothetical protein